MAAATVEGSGPGGAHADLLWDRAAAVDVVTSYATALDSRDWSLFGSLFEDTVEIDYRSLGASYGVFTAREWVDRCRMLQAFRSTHHKVGNFAFLPDANAMMVTSYVDAAHFIENAGRVLEAFVLGVYRHDLVKRGDDWRIARCQLTVTGYPGGKDNFDAAFAVARAAAT